MHRVNSRSVYAAPPSACSSAARTRSGVVTWLSTAGGLHAVEQGVAGGAGLTAAAYLLLPARWAVTGMAGASTVAFCAGFAVTAHVGRSPRC
ncbi:hypothetical protein ACF08E_27520 [Streptomyces globisporus]|uniref:hypothetical protein n=1 Tax=Streptomyces globisporus TaxID=1908 RepID=UPI0036F5AA24